MVELEKISDKRYIQFLTSLGYDSNVFASLNRKIACKFMLKSQWRWKSVSILYVFDTSTSSSLVDFFCLFKDDCNLFQYPPYKLFSTFHISLYFNQANFWTRNFFSPKLLKFYIWFVHIRVSTFFKIGIDLTFVFVPKSRSRFMLNIISISFTLLVVIHFRQCSVKIWVDSIVCFFERLYLSVFGIFPLLTLAFKNRDNEFEKKLFSLEYSWLEVNV